MGRVRRNFVLILRFKYDSQYRCGNAILPDHRGRRYSCRKREKTWLIQYTNEKQVGNLTSIDAVLNQKNLNVMRRRECWKKCSKGKKAFRWTPNECKKPRIGIAWDSSKVRWRRRREDHLRFNGLIKRYTGDRVLKKQRNAQICSNTTKR